METKFNFKSAICTDRFQSERLLALGLKKETADMGWVKLLAGDGYVMAIAEDYSFIDIPAWSLGRLIEMLQHCQYEGKQDGIFVHGYFPFPQLISTIEYLNGIGKFNKEYLV